MKKHQHSFRNEESSEEQESFERYNHYLPHCTPAIEKFFITLDSGDDTELAQSLIALSEELSLTEEQVLMSQPLDKALSLLLDCLESPNSEIQTHSMACIALILDTLPELSEVIIECDGVQKICEKISNPADIELCDQGIRALEKISFEFPLESLEAKAIQTCLNVMEYLDSEIQKKILNIICNCAKEIRTQKCVDFQVLPVIPQVLELVKNKQNLNNRVEKVLEFLYYFIENLIAVIPPKSNSFKTYSKALVDFGILNWLLELFPSQATQVTGLLCKLCSRFSSIVKKLLSIGGFNLIKNEILGNSIKNLPFTAVLELLDSILPKFPPNNSWGKEKLNFLNKNPKFLQEISEAILPRTRSISEKFLSKEDKFLMISVLEKILKISNVEMVSHYLTAQGFGTFLSELIASKDLSTVRAALRISLNLYEKIPSKISGNFAREGLIARISELKDPDRLKEFKKIPEKKSGDSEETLFQPSESKNPYQQEIELFKANSKVIKSATLEDYKKEVQMFAKKILEKHKTFENKKTSRIGKEVKIVSQKLLNSFGESANEILLKITALLNSSDKLSFYEISNSLISESLWKWLAETTYDKVYSRTSEFFKIFSRDSSQGDTFFGILVKYLIGTANFVHHFRILLHDRKSIFGNKKKKARIVLEYIGSSACLLAEDEEFRVRHDLFLVHHKIQFEASLFLTFEKIREILIRLTSETDLYILIQQKMVSETTVHLFLDRPYCSKYQVMFYSNSREIARSTTVFNLHSKKLPIHLKFKIMKRPSPCDSFKYLKSPSDIFEYVISESTHVGIDPKDKSYSYFRLVKYLYSISDFFPHLNYLLNTPNLHPVPLSTFCSTKLSALLSRQLQDNTSTEGNAPASWVKSLPTKSRFLFSTESRVSYLEGFGFASVSHIEKKHKIRVDRSKILKNALSTLADSGLHIETILEVEYEGEVGTGLGPTIEFFTLVSNEIKSLKIWREICDESGLFPAPLSVINENWEDLFEFIGKFIGKAIIDKRHIDFQLSPAFWKLIFNHPVSLVDLLYVDRDIGKHLIDLSIHPAEIEKTGLTFTLPAYYQIDLKPGGNSLLVTKANLEEYIFLAASLTLNQIPQAKAVAKGIDSILPVEILSLLTVPEIEDILLGENDSLWEVNELKTHIVPSHGYSESSKTFLGFLDVLARFSADDRKKFLEFVTGFPRLPLGGFKSLSPKLTVVKKDAYDNPDNCLPSVMTCQNYLKIPDYSSCEILEQKLKVAINEGRFAFHLS